jgi:hypothetical protein
MFADRVELASCALAPQMSGDAGKLKVMDFATHFYGLDALNGDAALHGCLQLGGRWNAVPRDSHEYKREMIRGGLDKANRALENLQGLQGVTP